MENLENTERYQEENKIELYIYHLWINTITFFANISYQYFIEACIYTYCFVA